MMEDRWENERDQDDRFTCQLYDAVEDVEQLLQRAGDLTDTNIALVLAITLVKNIADGDSIDKYNSAHGFIDVALRYQGLLPRQVVPSANDIQPAGLTD